MADIRGVRLAVGVGVEVLVGVWVTVGVLVPNGVRVGRGVQVAQRVSVGVGVSVLGNVRLVGVGVKDATTAIAACVGTGGAPLERVSKITAPRPNTHRSATAITASMMIFLRDMTHLLIEEQGHDLKPVHVHQSLVGDLERGNDRQRQE